MAVTAGRTRRPICQYFHGTAIASTSRKRQTAFRRQYRIASTGNAVTLAAPNKPFLLRSRYDSTLADEELLTASHVRQAQHDHGGQQSFLPLLQHTRR
ncbi:MAG: hypothetical protein MRJ92_07980 [Nitrospira sp.]|nr:hypothetical protein [Nitrospira sp.]